MKRFILVLIFIVNVIFGIHAQSRKEIKIVANALKGMVKIPKVSSYWVGTDFRITETVADSNFIVPVNAGRSFLIDVELFYLSDHEVTNKEYRIFIGWVRDSVMKLAVKPLNPLLYRFTDLHGNIHDVNVLPDSLRWVDSHDHLADLLTEQYHNNSEFDSYPVVNVSWEQAQAYIHWLNNRFKELLMLNHLYTADWGLYRLPEVSEWECAVFDGQGWLDENQTAKRIYPWEGWSLMYGNKYYANFGSIVDQNGVIIKYPSTDGYSCTAPVKSYGPGMTGLYDMAGNVSEWTNTAITLGFVRLEYQLFYRELLGDEDYTFLFNEIDKENPDWSLFERELNKPLSKDTIGVERYRPHMSDILTYLKDSKKDELQYIKVLSNKPDAIIVKGGSWSDAPCYLMNTSRQALSPTTASPEVGFRVALTLSPELQKLLEKYMLKK